MAIQPEYFATLSCSTIARTMKISAVMVVLHETNLTNDTEQPPPSKRIRQEQPAPLTNKSVNDQRLFAPFRALGLITNHVPFVLQTRSHKGAIDGPKVHILTCLGRSWALWEGGKMTLLFVGEYAYVAYGNNHIVV
jgi:hypothetical protein